ncbi:MAG: histidine phosphatase family protein [Actinobacteria bacterium]|nr:histidine phosphatase family protein [Actinomycetota bacterium]
MTVERDAFRVDAPLYVARYREREAARRAEPDGDGAPSDDGLPLYLRQFRARQRGVPAAPRPDAPLWQRASLEVQRALTEDSRNKESSPPPEARTTALHNDAMLIRHGETQGYSTDSGLTPQGVWQAHTYGHTLAKRIKSGETIVFRHAPTARARETAEHVHRGLVDGLVQFEKDVTIHETEPMEEFRNFQFASPEGLRDVTAAFRSFYAIREDYERRRTGDRPLWLVEMDRFWKTQQGGGDPIQHWLTVPMLHFEPPAMCVRRFWSGIVRLGDRFPQARLAIATHSGPIRAFAVAALGYDPGEPYNTEHVRVKIMDGRQEATVAYRNRVQETRVPDIGRLPQWSVDETWVST